MLCCAHLCEWICNAWHSFGLLTKSQRAHTTHQSSLTGYWANPHNTHGIPRSSKHKYTHYSKGILILYSPHSTLPLLRCRCCHHRHRRRILHQCFVSCTRLQIEQNERTLSSCMHSYTVCILIGKASSFDTTLFALFWKQPAYSVSNLTFSFSSLGSGPIIIITGFSQLIFISVIQFKETGRSYFSCERFLFSDHSQFNFEYSDWTIFEKQKFGYGHWWMGGHHINDSTYQSILLIIFVSFSNHRKTRFIAEVDFGNFERSTIFI